MKEYFKLKKENKKIVKDEIARIDEVVKQLAEVVAGQNLIIEELQKDSYKEKFKEEHKKFKEYEKESKAIIEELTEQLKKDEKELKKLKKEN